MVYISGPITGVDNYFTNFYNATFELMDMGYSICDIVNPSYNAYVCRPGKLSWKTYVDVGLLWLSCCDTIYMLKGWENSLGAKLELNYAKSNNYNIIYQGS